MKVEVLYFEGCPSWQMAVENLRTACAALDLPAEVELIRVETDEAAQVQHFTGSPTLRVDGADLFPTGQEHYALGCRVYHTPEGLRGWPSTAMIQQALSEKSG